MRTVRINGNIFEVDQYYSKVFTNQNTDKAFLAKYSKLMELPADEVIRCLNSLQKRDLIVRLTKNKILMVDIIF